jgi:predicted HicB family RNase H-like nuclease
MGKEQFTLLSPMVKEIVNMLKKPISKKSSKQSDFKKLNGYKIEIDSDDEGIVYASIYDSDFVLLGQGKTLNEAFDCLSEQLQMALNDLDPEKYSGNFNLRIPPTLHARLAKVAKLQDKSINELVIGGINQIVNL